MREKIAKFLAPLRPAADCIKEFLGSVREAFRARGSVLLALAMIGAAGAALRLAAIDRPLGLDFRSLYLDERKILDNTSRVMAGKPLQAHYPYALYRWLVPQFSVAKRVVGLCADSRGPRKIKMSDFDRYTEANPMPFVLLLRANMVLFSLLIVGAVFAVARKLAGDAAGLCAALLAAVSSLLVNYARMAYYDMPAAFWFTLTTGFLAWSWRRRSFPGVWIGGALAAWTVTTKQNTAVIGALWLATALRILWPADRDSVRKSLLHLAGAGMLALAVGLWCYPTLLDFDSVRRFGDMLQSHYNVAGTNEAKHLPPLWWAWITDFWPREAPIAVFWMLALGLALLPVAGRNRTLAWFLVAAAAGYTLTAGRSTHLIDRTMLPLLPALFAGLAGWVALAGRFAGPRAGVAVAVLLGVFAAVPLLSNCLRDTLLLAGPDTRALAMEWIRANAPPGSKIAVENYCPQPPEFAPGKWPSQEVLAGRLAAYELLRTATLGNYSLDHYRREGFKFLVMTPIMEEKSGYLHLQGAETNPGDPERLRYGKTPQFSVPVAEALKNYKEIREGLPVAASFEPRHPPAALYGSLARSYGPGDDVVAPTRFPYWNPDLLPLLLGKRDYVIGPRVMIYGVKAPGL